MPFPVKGSHFLLQAKARTLKLGDIYEKGEDWAYGLVCKLRWPQTDGAPICPKCGGVEPYLIATRKIFKCRHAGCHHQFTPTSGTILHSRKMRYVDTLAAVCLFVNGAKGQPALEMARHLRCSPKAAWVLCHKLREALAVENRDRVLSGVVEVDGGYFGGYVKPANNWENRRDRRLAANQSGKRRVVVVARERRGHALTAVFRSEHEGVDFIRAVVAPDAQVHADEASHWDVLHARFDTRRINHRSAYSTEDSCTNQAESIYARMRKMVEGQHHHASPDHLHAYASHTAWLENHRHKDNGELFALVLSHALHHPVSRNWKGRWQRRRTVSGTRR